MKNIKYLLLLVLGLLPVSICRAELIKAPIESIPTGIANVIEYHGRGTSGMPVWNTNMVRNWWGTWAENTNSGWRVLVRIYETNTSGVRMTVHVGSVFTNSGSGLLPTPDSKFAKLDLLDPDGNSVSTKPGAALALYEYDGTNIFRSCPLPSPRDASVARIYPTTISDIEYPRWKSGYGHLAGRFVKFVGFVSNGPPCHIGYIKFNEIFNIKRKGVHTLTVQPVVFRMHLEGGTFQGYLDRVDLPSVTLKVYLIPTGE